MLALIIPPNVDKLGFSKNIFFSTRASLGTCYVASYMRENGVKDFKLLDTVGHDMSMEQIYRKLDQMRPDIVGIGTMTQFIRTSNAIAKYAKENLGAKVVMGGVHPTLCTDEVIRKGYVDFVVRNEGEETFTEFMQGKDIGKISGLSYKKGGKIIHNPARLPVQNLDTLPMPARDLLPMEKYIADEGGYKGTNMITSRGCPFGCIYCASSAFWGRRIRFHSAQRVLDEMEHLKRTYHVSGIRFDDDHAVFDNKRMLDICTGMEDRNLNVKWSCLSRTDSVNQELLDRMAQSGCVSIDYGVESGSPRILEILKKGVKLEQVERAVSMTSKAGMESLLYFMIGHPTETKEDAWMTYQFAKKLTAKYKARAFFFITVVYPGTELYEIAKKRIGLKVEDWSEYVNPYYQDRGPIYPFIPVYTETFSVKELIEMHERFTSVNVRNMKWLIKQGLKARNPRAIKKGLMILRQTVREKKL